MKNLWKGRPSATTDGSISRSADCGVRRLGPLLGLRGPEEHLDLYFEDGSMLSLDSGSPEAERLLPFARDLLSTAG